MFSDFLTSDFLIEINDYNFITLTFGMSFAWRRLRILSVAWRPLPRSGPHQSLLEPDAVAGTHGFTRFGVTWFARFGFTWFARFGFTWFTRFGFTWFRVFGFTWFVFLFDFARRVFVHLFPFLFSPIFLSVFPSFLLWHLSLSALLLSARLAFSVPLLLFFLSVFVFLLLRAWAEKKNLIQTFCIEI